MTQQNYNDLSAMRDKLKEALFPLYKDLYGHVFDFNESKSFFFTQWGKNFPVQPNSGILFVGKANNGWGTVESIDHVCDGFDLPNQMQWIEDQDGDPTIYDTSKSAFFRVMKAVSQHFYPENWSSYVAWSNVCKVAPAEGGNPSDSLYNAQMADCGKILQAEVQILSPKIIVFFTGINWGYDYLCYLNNENNPATISTEKWGDGYESIVYKTGDFISILSPHPQGKPEQSHTECLIKLISDYM